MTHARSKTASKKSPAPRAALTPARIVEAALALIGDDGLDAFSTRRLGERLGCEAMSIYHHFPSKKHLLDALVDHAISSVDAGVAARDPVERLRHLLRSYRAMANRWPGLYPLIAVHRLNTPIGVALIERFIAALPAVVPD